MEYIFGVLQLLLIIVIIKREYDNKSPVIFMWATLLIMFAIPHFITVLFKSSNYSDSVLFEASVFVTLFCIIYLLSRVLLFKANRIVLNSNLFRIPINKEQIFTILLIGLFLVVAFKFYMIVKTAGSLFSSSWATGREISNSENYLSLSNLILSMYYPFSSVLLLSLINKKRKYVIWSSLIIILCVLVTRNRIEILPLLISYILYYISKGANLSLKKIVYFSFVGLVSMYLIYALLIFRHYGTFGDFISNFEFNDFNSRIFDKVSEGGELNLREVFYYFIENDNNFKDFEKGHTYIRMLLVLIPTSFSFGIKPPDFAITMGAAYMPYLQGFSTHPTLFGDAYANLGVFGCLLGVFWAFFAFFWDNVIRNLKSSLARVMVVVSLCSSYIIIARGSVYNAFAIFIFGLIIIYFYSIVSKIFLSKV
ncbi:oligosaccharide repeat unit polymerase [Myroides sp. BIT-d1]|uniref:Oligosaccharide repeat unit polymerase n=1 Tax=Myroides albus TaxID=2562892 RepID=A0A6I3LLJ5_9FLAO|nr:O-antigen polymerase [Myroides albus]MTG98557.1 oligosaccharide repeat unit polymerase [Myroides albus]